MTAADPAFTLDDVTVTINGRVILGPITFTVRQGERWALLGPNGAGKTTLLSLAGAVRHPTGGTVTVLGGTLGRVDLRPLRHRIGSVGHTVSDRLPRDQTTLEIVLTGKDGLLASWWGTYTDADRVDATALLGRVGLGDLVEQTFGYCSQGERQRVLLARALFGNRELLLLDEPSVGVDLPGREALIAALDDLARSGGPPTIHVAHTLEELPATTTHALLLRAGRAVASGPIADVLVDEHLSACYGLPVVVEQHDGRYFARAASSW